MNFLGGSFRIGRLFGIDVHVHFLFLLMLAFRLLSAGQDMAFELAFWTMLFGIVLLHEFGHCFGARSVGGDARNILLWPLGGLAYAHAPMRPWPQFVTVAAGPAVNVVFCAACLPIIFTQYGGFSLEWLNPLDGAPLFRQMPTWLFWVVLFYNVNLFLLGFNLLPIYPLDGGQMFHSIIWPYVGLQNATRIACQVGLAGALVLGVLGVYMMGQGGTVPFLLFIALFGGFTCWQRLKMANAGMLVEDDRFSYDAMNYGRRREGFFARIFKRPPRKPTARKPVNPNPGGWDTRQQEQQRLAVEVDRILKKVHEQGINSLSYVERQMLEKLSRQRQADDREFDHRTNL